jgi:predicted 3-demethylubiquinone-9 3-methyltransferase (glyoxalase superfamily)
MISDTDQDKAGRATQAMLKMKKLIIKDLEAAFEGKE